MRARFALHDPEGAAAVAKFEAQASKRKGGASAGGKRKRRKAFVSALD